MSGHSFSRYELRTTEVEGARAFYDAVLGAGSLATRALAVAPLPERARAAGAPAHWLGHIGVSDVTESVARFTAMGAQALGPTLRTDDGASVQGLRDPLGAVVALTSRAPLAGGSPVGWHQLHTTDRDKAWSSYAELFGWTARGTREMGGEEHLLFSFEADGPIAGSIASTALSPQTHTHWLFYFGVADLDAALASVRASGGDVIVEAALPTGERLAPCHDPQGAAFGLFALR